ncbi:hypothetical protein ACQZ6F_07835 [Rhizobium sp. A22-96]
MNEWPRGVIRRDLRPPSAQSGQHIRYHSQSRQQLIDCTAKLRAIVTLVTDVTAFMTSGISRIALRLGETFMKKHAVALMMVLAICIPIATMKPAFAADDVCAPVRAMLEKFNVTSRIRLVGTNKVKAINFTSLFVDTKQWWHEDSKPWHIEPRQYSKTSDLENCEHLGSEIIDGIRTEIWNYDHLAYQQVDYFKIWISDDTGLPVKSHFKRVRPKAFIEWDGTYTYGSDIKDPV